MSVDNIISLGGGVSEFPANRLYEFGCLTATERQELRALGGEPQTLPRSAVIKSEGSPDRAIYLLAEGWAASSLVLRDGQRQIIKFHLPGDFLGTTSMCVDRAIDTVTAVTEVVVRRVSLERLGMLMARSARISAYLLLSAQKERIALIDRLAWVGRANAKVRVATFFADTFERLRNIGLTDGNSFDLPLTQGQIADHLGLTSIHVSRVLRRLANDDLIKRAGPSLIVVDCERLRSVAAVPYRCMSDDLRWFAGGSATSRSLDEIVRPSRR